jgi:hypothetical protein
MALRFCDSFDHYVTADLSEKWTNVISIPAISASNGRRGTSALSTVASSRGVSKTLDNQATWIIGFALKFLDFSGGVPLLAVLDTGTVQVDILLNFDGTVTVRRNSSTALTGGTSTKAFAPGIYYFVEFKVTIADSIGANTCKMRVDGEDWLTVATGQDTKHTSNATANSIRLFGGAGSFCATYIDDLYICDGTGGSNNDFLGDVRVDAMLPNGDGSNSAWTCSTGSTHYALVDESAPNDDTDYLSTAGASNRDSHAMTNLPTMTSPTIKGLMHSIAGKKDDAGSRNIKSLCKSGATTSTGTSQVLPSSYTYLTEIYQTDPDTASAWTESGLNAAEFGVENV